jgi:hypothetical protein
MRQPRAAPQKKLPICNQGGNDPAVSGFSGKPQKYKKPNTADCEARFAGEVGDVIQPVRSSAGVPDG